MPEKGVCLARCTGELHPGPSGWIYVNSEALDFLLSGERNSGKRDRFPIPASYPEKRKFRSIRLSAFWRVEQR